jgi:hypothetical protein
MPDHVEAFPSDVSKLSTTPDGYRLTIHINMELACTAMAADPNVRSLGHSVALGAEAGRALASDPSTRAYPGGFSPFLRERPAHFCGKGIVLDFDHNAVLDTVPPSVLKLPMDWPATKVPALSWSLYRLLSVRQSALPPPPRAPRQFAYRQLAYRQFDPVFISRKESCGCPGGGQHYAQFGSPGRFGRSTCDPSR